MGQRRRSMRNKKKARFQNGVPEWAWDITNVISISAIVVSLIALVLSILQLLSI